MLATILIVVVVLMLVGTLPRWNHSREWGYFPSWTGDDLADCGGFDPPRQTLIRVPGAQSCRADRHAPDKS
jgi:hypothetical protein